MIVLNLTWCRQLHLFTNAFYNIEYGIAQLGALQAWADSRRNKMKALALGGCRSLPELFENAGCRFDFSRNTLAPLVQMLQTELGKPGSA